MQSGANLNWNWRVRVLNSRLESEDRKKYRAESNCVMSMASEWKEKHLRLRGHEHLDCTSLLGQAAQTSQAWFLREHP